jgi:hypothetical protein
MYGGRAVQDGIPRATELHQCIRPLQWSIELRANVVIRAHPRLTNGKTSLGHHGIHATRLPLWKPLCALCPQLEQRLSLIDFRHFSGRRKAIKGRPENRTGFSGAAGRLIELGE